jgi:uroporphyrin-III C-methyltransferase/precorrin-2 dehydrogenase/sirohydrochlorin ferrochelatase
MQSTRQPASHARAAACFSSAQGPGDPELLTMKAVRALKAADVILYDGLSAMACSIMPAARPS